MRSIVIDDDVHIIPTGDLHEVRDIAVSPQGTIWVLNGVSPYVIRIEGDARLEFASAGMGPGEVSNPQGLVVANHGVTVWDLGNRSLKHFSPDGQYTGQVAVESSTANVRGQLEKVTYGASRWLRPLGPGLIRVDFPSGAGRPTDLLHTVLLYRSPTGSVDTIIDFATLLPESAADSLGAMVALNPVPLWNTCSDEALVILDPFTPQLLRIDRVGNSAIATPIEVSAPDLTLMQVRTYLLYGARHETRGQVPDDQLEQAVDRIIERNGGSIGRVAPIAVDLICDDRGRVWLQQFSVEEAPPMYGADWLVIEADGRIGDHVRFPAGFKPFVVVGDSAVGIRVDSLEVQQLAVVQLPSAW